MNRFTSSARIAIGLASLSISILLAGKTLGLVPERLDAAPRDGVLGFLQNPVFEFIVYLVTASFVAHFLYLRQMLKHLDPARVIPERVRAALDTLAAGLLVIDNGGRILLANRAFTQIVGRELSQLQGVRAADLHWRRPDTGEPADDYPWLDSIQHSRPRTGTMLALDLGEAGRRTFVVNCSPIAGEDGIYRGVLASFDDVTPLEQKKADLSRMLEMLKKSSDEIRRQNEELELLATRDPLTSCLNRRSFFQQFESQWKTAQRHAFPLCCVMLDVDHFKTINDTYGHSAGDQVLQKVAALLRDAARDGDLVCRFGGEEFCILLPHTDIEHAAEAAERFREAIAQARFAGVSITASLGVSAMSLGAGDPQTLLDQADKCLYVAKRNGRNQVVRWDRMPADVEIDHTKISRTAPATAPEPSVSIPFQAVTALISALSYRELATAEHSRRVADLCVSAARGLMSLGECYVLEIAALLHDIGKIGVPDSILLKPGALTAAEWEVMRTQDRIGVEIIRASFNCPELSAIVENHHAWFGGNPREPGLPTGRHIPLGARLLTLADAYDAMISDRVYRKGISPEEAFGELRRCAGLQFDPELVEHFIERIRELNANQIAHTAPTVSKETALSIGLQIERLVAAVDSRDLSGLQALAGRLQTVAAKRGVDAIAELAANLQQAVSSETDLVGILSQAHELIELCRSTQHSYFRHAAPVAGPSGDSEPARPAPAVT